MFSQGPKPRSPIEEANELLQLVESSSAKKAPASPTLDPVAEATELLNLVSRPPKPTAPMDPVAEANELLGRISKPAEPVDDLDRTIEFMTSPERDRLAAGARAPRIDNTRPIPPDARTPARSFFRPPGAGSTWRDRLSFFGDYDPQLMVMRGLGHGVSSAIEMAGGVSRWAGQKLAPLKGTVFGAAPSILDTVGDVATHAGSTAREAITGTVPDELLVDVLEQPQVLLDPRWWSMGAGEALGSLIGFSGPGAAGARAAGALAGRVGKAVDLSVKAEQALRRLGFTTGGTAMEAVFEGGLAYNEAIEQGKTPDEAAAAAARVASKNAALIATTGGLAYGLPGGRSKVLAAIRGAVLEGGQEAAQETITNVEAGRPWEAGIANAAIIGGLAGAGTSPVSEAMSRGQVRKLPDGGTEIELTLTGEPSAPAADLPLGRDSGDPSAPEPAGDVDLLAGRTQAQIMEESLDLLREVSGSPDMSRSPEISGTPDMSGTREQTDDPAAAEVVGPDVLSVMGGPVREQGVTPKDVSPEPEASADSAPAADPVLEILKQPTPSKFAELNVHERREVRRILAEMESYGYEGHTFNEIPRGHGGSFEVVGGHGGAEIFNVIQDGRSGTRDAVQRAIRNYVDGKRPSPVAERTVQVARRILAGDPSIKAKRVLGKEAGDEPGQIYVERKRKGEIDAAVEEVAAARLEADPTGFKAKYRERFGNVLNADSASELFEEYAATPETRAENMRAVRSASGALVENLYDEMLQEPVHEGKFKAVAFMAGGTGSGKSSTVKNDPMAQGAHVVMDTTLADYDATMRNIARALGNGFEVYIADTYRDPLESWTDGVLPRAMGPEGRSVPVRAHANTHVKAHQNVLRLAEQFKDDPRVSVGVWENVGQGDVEARDLAWLARKSEEYNDGNVLETRLRDLLAVERAEGRIDERVFRASDSASSGGVRPANARPARADVQAVPRELPQGDSARHRGARSARESASVLDRVKPRGLEPQPHAAGNPNALGVYQTVLNTVSGPPKGRPISEQQAIARLTEIFAQDRATPKYQKWILGQAKASLPVRTGKFRQRALGLYYPKAEIIRLKRAFDLEVFDHELGHHIDLALFEKHGRPSGLFKDELLALGAPTTPPGQTKKYQIQEGVAEYFRIWLRDSAAAKAEAPQFTGALMDVLAKEPVLEAQLYAARDVVQRFLRQPLEMRGKARPAIPDGPLEMRGKARINIRPSGIAGRVRDVLSEMQATESIAGFRRRFVAALKNTGNVPAMMRDPHRWFDRMMTLWFDRHTAIKRAVADMADGDMKNLPASQNAYLLTRLADSTAGMAEGFLQVGVRGMDGQFIGPALKSVLSPVRDRLYPDPKDLSRPDLASYLYALRSIEVRGSGRDPGMRSSEAREILKDTQKDPDFEKFEAAQEGIQRYVSALRTYARMHGMLSASSFAKLEQAMYYVPLQRVIDEVQNRAGGRSKIADRTSPIMQLKGSGRDIIDPIESLVKNTAALVDAVEKNRAALALVRAAKDAQGGGQWLQEIPQGQVAASFNLDKLGPEIRRILADAQVELPDNLDFDELVTVFLPATFGKPGERIITVISEGKRKFYQIQDEALYENITALGVQPVTGILRIVSKPTAVLRAGATLRPSFIVRNLMRDSLGAMMQSRHGFVPVYDNVRGLIGQIRKDDDYKRYLAFGIQQSSLLAMDRDRVRAFLDKELRKQSVLGTAVRTVTSPIEALRYLSEQIENATRLGEFKLGLDTGGKERRVGVLGIAQRSVDLVKRRKRPELTEDVLLTAALAARDVTVDFARGGQWAKTWSQFDAFRNARIQGYVRIGETFARDPQGASLTVGALTLLSFLLWGWNKDDEEYQEILAQEKRDYWHVKLPGNETFTRFAKPFEWAFVPNVMEEALNQTWKNQPKERAVLDALHRELKAQFVGLAGTYLETGIEVAANFSFYRDRPIVSPWLENREADLQTNDFTSPSVVDIASALDVSPAKLEHLIYGYGAGLARDAVSIIDTVRGTTSDRPSMFIDQYPALGAFLRHGGFDTRAESINDFYKKWKEYEGMRASLKAYKKGEGRADATVYESTFRAKFPPEREAALKAAKKALDGLHDKMDGVYGNKALTPAQKRQELNIISREMVDVTRRGLGRSPLKAAAR